MTEQTSDETTQPNSNTDDLTQMIEDLKAQMQQVIDSNQSLPTLIESTVEDILTRRQVINRDEITELITETLQKYPTRDEMDKRQIDMFAQFNSALKQSIDSLLPAFGKRIDEALRPVTLKLLEFGSLHKQAEEERKALRAGHEKQQDLYAAINATVQSMSETMKEIKVGLLGEDGGGGVKQEVRQVKTDMKTVEGRVLAVEGHSATYRTELNEFGSFVNEFREWRQEQKEQREAMKQGTVKFIKYLITGLLTLGGTGVGAVALEAFAKALGG